MMTRWIVAFGLVLTLALTAPLGNEAGADGFVRGPASYTKKRCIAPAMQWFRMQAAQTTWVCAAAEKCCYDRLLRKGTCIAGSARCF